PQRGFRVGSVEPVDFTELFNGFVRRLGLSAPGVHVTQASQINSSQQPARLHIVGIAPENVFRFALRFPGALRLPIHFREAFANYRGSWVQRISLFVGFDGFRSVVRVARGFILLLVNVAHRVVVIGLGTRGIFLRANRLGFSEGIFWRDESLAL